jgi:hypothetical protein
MMADTRDDDQKAQDINRMLGVLKRIREMYEPMIENVIKYVNHGRRLIVDNSYNKGQKTGMDVYDGTALSALNLLTDGVCGYSVSKSYRWFNYTLPGYLNFPRTSGMRAWSGKRMDEYPEVRQWLEDDEEVMYSAFIRSNFYDAVPEMVRDAASIGTTTPIIEEDMSKGRVIFTVPHFRELYIAEDRYGQVDTRYRVYKLTLRQMADKFGVDVMKKADPSFEQSFEKDPHAEKEVIHAIYPRSDFDLSIVNALNKPVASMWVLTSPLKVLLESGYDESPIMSWRWRKNSDEIYGRSPAWDSYVEIMKANQQEKTNLIAGHKMVEPPMMAPEDLRGKINNTPRGWTFMDRSLMDKAYPRPLMTNIQLPFGIDQQERSDKVIREFFHVDFFLMLWQASQNKVELTATQVVEMAGEKAAILGTRIGRMETELCNPIHDRVFAIETRAKRIPTPPQILLDTGGGHIEIDYLGPLAQAQKRIFKSQTIRAGLQMVTEVSQTYPEAAMVIDPIKTLRDLLDSQGFPQKDFRTDDEINKILELKHQQQDQEKALAQAAEIAKGASRLTKEVQPGSPIDLLANPQGAAMK